MTSADRLNRYDVALMAGLLTCILAFLFLISAPGALYRWLHRDGYRSIEIIVIPPARSPATSRSISVQIVATGERLSVRKSKFESPMRYGRREVLFNPEARLDFGARIFDERVTTRPISASEGVVPFGLGMAFAVLGIGLLRYGYKEGSRRRRKRRR